MVCPTCYQDYISKCSTSLIVNAQLDPDTEFTWVIIDKFNNMWNGQTTTDANGLATLDVSSFAEGLFTPYSGYFELHLYEVSPYAAEVILTIGSTAYDCIEFDVRGGNYVKTYLGEFTEEPVSS